jgi:hypothetical protein
MSNNFDFYSYYLFFRDYSYGKYGKGQSMERDRVWKGTEYGKGQGRTDGQGQALIVKKSSKSF